MPFSPQQLTRPLAVAQQRLLRQQLVSCERFDLPLSAWQDAGKGEVRCKATFCTHPAQPGAPTDCLHRRNGADASGGEGLWCSLHEGAGVKNIEQNPAEQSGSHLGVG